MILANGKLYDTKEQAFLLEHLEEEINTVRASKRLAPETVVEALAELGRRIAAGVFDELIAGLELDGGKELAQEAARLLSRESILYKLESELGAGFFQGKRTSPPVGRPVTIRPEPLGTLFHIAAGNADGLPAFSVAEGLLTGNVNILKLPQADNGVSIAVLQELVHIAPELSGFLYVFDTPSSDLAAMKRMAEISDGIVVWGSGEAVTAVRRLAPVGVKLIEWGEKLGFAYIAGYEDKESELRALAGHIIRTKQLLCSSCQTIFLDTENMDEVRDFCAEFLPHLEAAAEEAPQMSRDAAAEITLRRYCGMLEQAMAGKANEKRDVFQGRMCRLTACPDHGLELSGMFGDCLVKPLPRERLFSALRSRKGVLQTAGLLCREEERGFFTDLLIRAGVVRVTRAGTMSEPFPGEGHDGEYPLRRYVRMVAVE